MKGSGNDELLSDLVLLPNMVHHGLPRRVLLHLSGELVLHRLGQYSKEQRPQRGRILLELRPALVRLLFPFSAMVIELFLILTLCKLKGGLQARGLHGLFAVT